MNQSNYRWAKTLAQVSSIALLILVSTAIGLGLGYWLDGKLGTKPWLAFVLTIVGLAAGLYEAVKILIEATENEGD
ncbi:AtpZ/AtpI family protein [bacterium]|nr:AtpZ/AtpI family protein [bacterium]